jgi:hypothetical protein
MLNSNRPYVLEPRSLLYLFLPAFAAQYFPPAMILVPKNSDVKRLDPFAPPVPRLPPFLVKYLNVESIPKLRIYIKLNTVQYHPSLELKKSGVYGLASGPDTCDATLLEFDVLSARPWS